MKEAELNALHEVWADAFEFKKQTRSLDSLTEMDFLDLAEHKCERLMRENEGKKPSQETYKQLSGQKLNVAELNTEILKHLVLEESVTTKEIAVLFNTTDQIVSDMRVMHKITDRDKIFADYKKLFKVACESIKHSQVQGLV